MKVLALTIDGRITECSAPPDQRGKGRCNHVAHMNENETKIDFIKRINEEFYYKDSKEILQGKVIIDRYVMSDEEKSHMVEITGRADLAKDIDNGYIHVEEPLWNDMDINKFSEISGIPPKTIIGLLKGKIIPKNNNKKKINKLFMITYVDPSINRKYRVGKCVNEETKKKIEEEFGNLVLFDTGVKFLNKLAKEKYDFEATKDIKVLPYYMRQDPPDSNAKNPINVHYNYLIVKRKDPDLQQAAYFRLLNNRGFDDPLTVHGGYAQPSLAEELNGKKGLFRNFMSGRRTMYSGRAVIEMDYNMEYGTLKIPAIIAADIYRPTLINLMKQEGKKDNEIEAFLESFKGDQEKEVTEENRQELNRLLKKSNMRVLANRPPSLHYSSLLCFKPEISPDATIKVSPLNLTGYSADFDGDTFSVYAINDVNISEKAERSMGAETISGTRLPRAQNVSINKPSKESLWGLLNILNNRSN